MSFVAIGLISASVVLHVLWNTIAKGRPSFAFFFVGNLFGALALTPILILNAGALGTVLHAIWPILVATGVAQAVHGKAADMRTKHVNGGRLMTKKQCYPIVQGAKVRSTKDQVTVHLAHARKF